MLTIRTALIGLAFVCVAVALPVALSTSSLLFNGSDSIPIGLYQRTRNSGDRYIGFCLPMTVLTAAKKTGLALPNGNCPGGVAPILKPHFAASPEQPISLTSEGFVIGGKLLPNTAPKPRSRTGAALTHYPFGLYTNGVWAISTFNPDSFDSRYFGPLDPKAIQFHARPLWTK